MNTIIGGYISLNAVITASSRVITKLYYDKLRLETVKRSTFHYPEKKQYERLNEYALENKIETVYLTDTEFATLTSGETYGGIAAEVGERIYTSVDELTSIPNGYFVMLDGIEDPFNFGYVLRTFYAAGVDGVFLPQRNFLSASNIVIRSSAGASELLKIAEYTNPEEVLQKLKQNGICIACTAKEEKSSNLYGAKFKRPVCIVIGGEKRGINKTILSYADKVLKIPYPRELTVSLSASAAASIIAFETARQLAYADKIAESHRQ